MYGTLNACLRPGSITPPVCILCPSLLPQRATKAVNVRHYTTDASLAFAAHVPSKKRKKQSKTVDPKVDEERAQLRAREQAVHAEMRRRALATLDKSAKFVAAGLSNIQGDPTLDDLDQLKPDYPPHILLEFVETCPSVSLKPRIPGPGIIKQHAAAFEKLVDNLVTKFTRKQLVTLHKDGFQRIGGKRRKATSMKQKTVRGIAAEIIRWRWLWPDPTEVEDRRSFLTTKVERSFQITTSEFFLLLGPDGSSLRELAENYGIVIKGVRRKNNSSFTLVVDGHGFELDRFANIVAERKKLIISESLHLGGANMRSLPTVPKNIIFQSDLLRRVSKQSNALVVDLGKNKFQISAHHARHIMLAKRLVLRAFQQICLSPPSLLINLPVLKHVEGEDGLLYALFPFELGSPDNIPLYWTPTSSLNQDQHSRAPPPLALSYHSIGTPTLYRVKKVEGWLALHTYSGIADCDGSQSKIIDSMGEPSVLREALGLTHVTSPNDELRQTYLTASLGHIIFSPTTSAAKTLLSPLQDPWPFDHFLKWMKFDTGNMTFIPDIPSYLTNSSPMSRTVLTRLVYRSSTDAVIHPGQPLKTLKFEMMPVKVEPVYSDSEMKLPFHNIAGNLGELSDLEDNTTFPTQQGLHGGDFPDQDEDSLRWSSSSSVKLWEGSETCINMMLPTRPMDIRLTSFHSTMIPLDNAPKELLDYAQSLVLGSRQSETAARPIPPMQVECNGRTYVLDLDATIKTSSHVLDGKDIFMNDPVAIMVENAVELESNEHTRSCLVVCSEPMSDDNLKVFMKTCEQLASNQEIIRPKYTEDLPDTDGSDVDLRGILH